VAALSKLDTGRAGGLAWQP